MKFIVLLLLVVSIPGQAQSRKEKQEAKQQQKIEDFNTMKALIDTSVYEFTANRAYPQGGTSIDLTTNPNFLRVMSDSAYAELPYFGRAYNVAYSGTNGGIRFQGKMDNFQVTENEKKLAILIEFEVSVPNDHFECTLEVYSRENASLSVLSQQRTHISYSGNVTFAER